MARTASAGRAPQDRNRHPSCPPPGPEQGQWSKRATSLPVGRRAGKARAAAGRTYLCARQPGWAPTLMRACLELCSPEEEPPLKKRGRVAGRHPHPGLRPDWREREGRERRFELRGRGGGVPPPETERVGCWSLEDGCAQRQQENRAESARGAGRGGGRETQG